MSTQHYVSITMLVNHHQQHEQQDHLLALMTRLLLCTAASRRRESPWRCTYIHRYIDRYIQTDKTVYVHTECMQTHVQYSFQLIVSIHAHKEHSSGKERHRVHRGQRQILHHVCVCVCVCVFVCALVSSTQCNARCFRQPCTAVDATH